MHRKRYSKVDSGALCAVGAHNSNLPPVPPISHPTRAVPALPSMVSECRGGRDIADHEIGSLPCPTDVIERAAMIEEGDGCDRVEATSRALSEWGFATSGDLAASHAERIRGDLAGIPSPCDLIGARLMLGTTRLLSSPHWCALVSAGWTLSDVFGADEWQPLERVDRMGLVVRSAVHAAKGRRIENITDSTVSFADPDGRLVSYRRLSLGDAPSVTLWWHSRVLVNFEAAA